MQDADSYLGRQMSEYHYYEFQALDRPLTKEEQRRLRALSTRATITSTSFINEYNWGNLPGNPDDWMDRYFDASLYTANGNYHQLQFRLPSARLSLATARSYRAGDRYFVREKNGNLVLTFDSDDDGDVVDDDRGTLASLVGVRTGLLHGDHRALYLWWLLGVQHETVKKTVHEPVVPAGLATLDASLESFVDFLRIDRDLIRAAAEASTAVPSSRVRIADVRKWVAAAPVKLKDAFLVDALVNRAFDAKSEIVMRFERVTASKSPAKSLSPRTAGEILRRVEVVGKSVSRTPATRTAKNKGRRRSRG